jgi:type IV pilus assembly protein PilX
MNIYAHNSLNRTRQRGAVLVVSLLLLLVMTVLALGASQATRMQERMAGNARDHDLALQTAEAGLRAGERLIDDPALTAAPTPCSSGRCQVYELNYLTSNLAYEDRPWWDANSWRYAGTETWNTATGDTTGEIGWGGSHMAASDPHFLIEEVEEVPDSLTVPPTGPPPSRMYYRVTSAGAGGTAESQVVLQSTFARRFN